MPRPSQHGGSLPLKMSQVEPGSDSVHLCLPLSFQQAEWIFFFFKASLPTLPAGQVPGGDPPPASPQTCRVLWDEGTQGESHV